MSNKIDSQNLSPLTLNLLTYEQKVLHRAKADRKITSTLFGKGVLLVSHSLANAEMVCKCIYVVFLLLKDIFSRENSSLLQKKKLEVIGSFRITAHSFFAIFNEKLISNIKVEEGNSLPPISLDTTAAPPSVQKKVGLETEKTKGHSLQNLLEHSTTLSQGLARKVLNPSEKMADKRKKTAPFSLDNPKSRRAAKKSALKLASSRSTVEIEPEQEANRYQENPSEQTLLQTVRKSFPTPVLKFEEEEILSKEAVRDRLESAKDELQQLQAKHERCGFVFQSQPVCLKANDPRWEVLEGSVGNILMSLCRYTSPNHSAKGDHIALNYSLYLGKANYPMQLVALFEAVKGPHAVTYVKAKLQTQLENQLRKWCKEELTDAGIYNALRNTVIELDRNYKKDNSQVGNLYTGESYLDHGATAIIALFLNGSMWTLNTSCARAVVVSSNEVALISLPSKGKAIGCNSLDTHLEPQIFKTDYMANQLLILQSAAFGKSCSIEELEETIGQIRQSSIEKVACDLVYSTRVGQQAGQLDTAVMVLQIPQSMPLPQSSSGKLAVLQSEKEEEGSLSEDYLVNGDIDDDFSFLGSPLQSPKIEPLNISSTKTRKEDGDRIISGQEPVPLHLLPESQKGSSEIVVSPLSGVSSFVIPSSHSSSKVSAKQAAKVDSSSGLADGVGASSTRVLQGDELAGGKTQRNENSEDTGSSKGSQSDFLVISDEEFSSQSS